MTRIKHRRMKVDCCWTTIAECESRFADAIRRWYDEGWIWEEFPDAAAFGMTEAYQELVRMGAIKSEAIPLYPSLCNPASASLP